MAQKDMSLKEVKSIITDMLKSAYKRKFGTDENAEVKFFTKKKDSSRIYVDILSKKTGVEEEDFFNEVTEIPYDEAVVLAGDEVEVGDTLEIPLNPRTFEYSAVQSAKQRGQQVSKEMTDDKTFIKAKSMEFTLVKGELKKIGKNNSDWLVDVGFGEENLAVFPLRGQSPRETYDMGDTLRFFVEKVDRGDEVITRDTKTGKTKKKKRGVKISLSRSCKEFVKCLLEAQLREEIDNGTVVIKSIARQVGVRTKVAVDTKKSDTDPVGATVGKAGCKIQTITNEIAGEKIDVVRYNEDPIVLIANALTPAQVQRVVEIDPVSKYAVAIVDDKDQGLAIGQNGVNVKLAKTLCDWVIDVKTKSQFNEMDQTQLIHETVGSLFKDNEAPLENVEEKEEVVKTLTNEEIGIAEGETPISDIGLDPHLVKKLHNADIWSIEEFFDYTDEELLERGISAEEIEAVKGSVEIVTEEEEGDGSFECPVCHEIVPAGSTSCPNCGAEFEFE